MYKCFKCGNEFEGRFCPKCGTEWKENKVCPQCGAMFAGNAKFCPECGAQYIEQALPKVKKNKFSAWLKKHLKAVITVTAAILVLVVMCSLIPTFILASVNGTYYKLLGETFGEKDYVTLKTGKWEDGKETGTYQLKNGVIIVHINNNWDNVFGGNFGNNLSTRKGEIKNGVIKFTDQTRTEIYCKKNHKHKYGKWETTAEANCTHSGEKRRTCLCGHVDFDVIPIAPQKHDHFMNERCAACGITRLKYELNSDALSYSVAGFQNGVTDKYGVVIWAEYEGLPVTSIQSKTFKNCKDIMSITIPNSITTFERNAFRDCHFLSILFQGTMEQWNKIDKENNWDYGTKYTVHCSDGDIRK